MGGELLPPEAIGTIGIALAAVGGWILPARRLRGTVLILALSTLLAGPAEAQQVRILEAAKTLAAETTLDVPQADDSCSPAPCTRDGGRQRPGRDATWVLLAVSAAVVVAVVISDGVRRPQPYGPLARHR